MKYKYVSNEKSMIVRLHYFEHIKVYLSRFLFQVTGELSASPTSLVDPTKNKYEVASQLIIHLLMAASAGDETALKW